MFVSFSGLNIFWIQAAAEVLECEEGVGKLAEYGENQVGETG